MEALSLIIPRPACHSRFSKALPEPPLQRQIAPQPESQHPPDRPALPPKDHLAASTPSTMTTKSTTLARVNTPPSIMPKRKPVGGGSGIQSVPVQPPLSPQPVRDRDLSPAASFSSLFSAYGTEDSGTQYSVDTAATQHSFTEPSPPKRPCDRPPIPSSQDVTRPASSKSPKLSLETSTASPASASPASVSSQSPSRPQIWRRRSIKSDKPQTVLQWKLALSHGSTMSPEQATSPVNNEQSAQPMRDLSLNGNRAQDACPPKTAPPVKMGHEKSKEALQTWQQSPSQTLPHVPRSPSPGHAKDEDRKKGPANYLPVSPMTTAAAAAAAAAVAPSSQAGAPPSAAAGTLAPSPFIMASQTAPAHERSTSRTSSTSIPTIPVSDDGDASTITAISPQPSTTAPLTIDTAAAAAAAAQAALPAQSPTSPAASPAPADDDDDDDADAADDDDIDDADLPRPGDPAYFPLRHDPRHRAFARPAVAPGAVLAAAPLRAAQLACFAGHYRFVAARTAGRNPVACATCAARDAGPRRVCAHCALRVCRPCCDALARNGRDVAALVAALRA